VTTAWDNSCHDGETTLPYSKSYSYSTPNNKKKWTLLPDSFSVSVAAGFFGLTGEWQSETVSMLTDTYSASNAAIMVFFYVFSLEASFF
jgi:hypothetical protein